MGDRLERTDVWQSYHDRVTGEIPVVVSDGDSERHDLFAIQDELRTAVLPEGDDD